MALRPYLLALGVGDIIELGSNKSLTGVPAGGAGTASVSLNSNGNWTGTTNGGTGDFSSTWITPTASAGANYEARVTINSGSLTGGSDSSGVWLSLGTSRFWFCLEPTDCNFTLEIRRASDGTVLDSCTVTLTNP